MKLTIFDRILLLNISSNITSDIETLELIQEFEKEISFSDEEKKKYKFKNNNGRIVWKEDNSIKDIIVNDKVFNELKMLFLSLNANKKLRKEHISLYKKFVRD